MDYTPTAEYGNTTVVDGYSDDVRYRPLAACYWHTEETETCTATAVQYFASTPSVKDGVGDGAATYCWVDRSCSVSAVADAVIAVRVLFLLDRHAGNSDPDESGLAFAGVWNKKSC